MSKKTYNVIKVREYTDGNGEVRKQFIEVGAAWEIETGGMSVELAEGLSLGGRFVILPRRDKAENAE